MLGMPGRGDRSHLVNHAHYLQVVQKHLAHVHLEDDVDALRLEVEAELHLAFGIDEDGPTQSHPDPDRGRATEGETMAEEVTIAEEIHLTPPMTGEPGELISSEVGQLTTIAV